MLISCWCRNHRRSHTTHLCPNGLLTKVVLICTLAAVMSVFLHNRDWTQYMPIQFIYRCRSDFIIYIHISNRSAADVLAPTLIRSAAFTLLRCGRCFIRTDGVLFDIEMLFPTIFDICIWFWLFDAYRPTFYFW